MRIQKISKKDMLLKGKNVATAEPWYEHCLKEIDERAKVYPRRYKNEYRIFIDGIRKKISVGLFLTPGQEKYLLGIHERMTEPTRIKW